MTTTAPRPTDSGPIGPTEHGSQTISWSPEDGGTVTVTEERANPHIGTASMLLGSGLAFGGIVKATKTSDAARAAATAAGLNSLDAARAGSRAGNRSMFAASALAAGALLGGALLAGAFGSERTEQFSMSRERFVQVSSGEPRGVPRKWHTATGLGTVIGGTAVGLGAGYVAAKLLSKAPAPVALAGLGAASIGGLVGTMWAAGRAVDAITD